MTTGAQTRTWTTPGLTQPSKETCVHVTCLACPHSHSRAETSRRKWTGVTGITRAVQIIIRRCSSCHRESREPGILSSKVAVTVYTTST
jgi:hypothetical protein